MSDYFYDEEDEDELDDEYEDDNEDEEDDDDECDDDYDEEYEARIDEIYAEFEGFYPRNEEEKRRGIKRYENLLRKAGMSEDEIADQVEAAENTFLTPKERAEDLGVDEDELEDTLDNDSRD